MLNKLSLKTKMILSLSLVSLAFVAVATIGWTGLTGANADQADAVREEWTMGLVSFFGLLALAFTVWTALSKTIRPLAEIQQVLRNLAEGETDVAVKVENRHDEIGNIQKASEALRKTVGESFQLRQLVEELPINIMQCEPKDFTVTYMNKATRRTLKSLEALLPAKVDDLIGKSIDIFHENPEHQRRILRDPKNLPHTAKIKLGNETLSLNVAAIVDKKGNYTGPVLSWNVVTAQVNMANRVLDVVNVVASASAEMEATAVSMTSTAEETNQQASTVAAASEQAATNVQTVASAAEEMSASIREISQRMIESARIAQRAVAQVEQTNASVQGLASAAEKIGDVVKLINDIAGQTNLLALNATIEAARAGEAGKGFAVVASEVKSLANQTAKATEDIAAQIAGIQSATSDSVAAMKMIATTIQEIDQVTTAVAAAVEEQGAATQEISRNVQQAAVGTQEVSSNIGGVSQAATQTGAAAQQVLTAAQEMSKHGQTLSQEIQEFLKSA